MRQPHGARELIAMRRARKRPVNHVVITDTPVISRLNRQAGAFVLYVDGPGEWDMRCVYALPVIVWCMSEAWVIDGDQLGLIESIAQARPAQLLIMSWEVVKAFPKAFAEAA